MALPLSAEQVRQVDKDLAHARERLAIWQRRVEYLSQLITASGLANERIFEQEKPNG